MKDKKGEQGIKKERKLVMKVKHDFFDNLDTERDKTKTGRAQIMVGGCQGFAKAQLSPEQLGAVLDELIEKQLKQLKKNNPDEHPDNNHNGHRRAPENGSAGPLLTSNSSIDFTMFGFPSDDQEAVDTYKKTIESVYEKRIKERKLSKEQIIDFNDYQVHAKYKEAWTHAKEVYKTKVLVESDIFLMANPADDRYKESDKDHLYLYKDKDGVVFYCIEGNAEKQYLKESLENKPLKFPDEFNSSEENLIKYDGRENLINEIHDITSKRGHTPEILPLTKTHRKLLWEDAERFCNKKGWAALPDEEKEKIRDARIKEIKQENIFVLSLYEKLDEKNPADLTPNEYRALLFMHGLFNSMNQLFNKDHPHIMMDLGYKPNSLVLRSYSFDVAFVPVKEENKQEELAVPPVSKSPPKPVLGTHAAVQSHLHEKNQDYQDSIKATKVKVKKDFYQGVIKLMLEEVKDLEVVTTTAKEFANDLANEATSSSSDEERAEETKKQKDPNKDLEVATPKLFADELADEVTSSLSDEETKKQKGGSLGKPAKSNQPVIQDPFQQGSSTNSFPVQIGRRPLRKSFDDLALYKGGYGGTQFSRQQGSPPITSAPAIIQSNKRPKFSG